jgi:hypothetical protein
VATVVAALTGPNVVVVTGTVYAMQAQLARALAGKPTAAAAAWEKNSLDAGGCGGAAGWIGGGGGGGGERSAAPRPAAARSPGYVVGLDDGFALWANDSLPARLFVTPRGRASRTAADEMFATAQR